MRSFARTSLALLLVSAGAIPMAAQDEPIPLEQVYQLVAKQQMRAAAYELGVASVGFRQELGRCRDPEVGTLMMETESRIDALAARLSSGKLTSTSALTSEFATIDHLLSEHHQQLAADGFAKPRFTTMQVVARDLRLAALYAARSARWEGQPLPETAQRAVDDAIRVAEKLVADPSRPPSETAAVITALGKVVKPTG